MLVALPVGAALLFRLTDLDGAAHVTLPSARLAKVVVRASRGDITVSGPGRGTRPVLDLKTSDGRIDAAS